MLVKKLIASALMFGVVASSMAADQKIDRKTNKPVNGPVKLKNRDGSVHAIEMYRNGYLHGKSKNLDGGKVTSFTTYRKGKRHGLSVRFFKNGKINTKTTYVDGLQHGRAYYYEEKDGKVYLQSTNDYVKGNVVGEYREYHKNGALIRLKTYAIRPDIGRSVLHGVSKDFDKEKRLREKRNYKYGKLHGWRITYYGDGTVKNKDCFEDDSPKKSSAACR